MSRENLVQFFQRVMAEPALQEQLIDCPDKTAAVRRVFELAAGFTTEELEALIGETPEQQEVSFPLDRIPGQAFY